MVLYFLWSWTFYWNNWQYLNEVSGLEEACSFDNFCVLIIWYTLNNFKSLILHIWNLLHLIIYTPCYLNAKYHYSKMWIASKCIVWNSFLKNILLILCGIHIMHPEPTHLPILASALCPCDLPLKTKHLKVSKTQNKAKQIKWITKISRHGGCSVAQYIQYIL